MTESKTVTLDDENRKLPAFTYLRAVPSRAIHGWCDSVERGEVLLFWRGETTTDDIPLLCALPTVEGCDLPVRFPFTDDVIMERGKHERFVQYLNEAVRGTFEIIDDLDELERLIGE